MKVGHTHDNFLNYQCQEQPQLHNPHAFHMQICDFFHVPFITDVMYMDYQTISDQAAGKESWTMLFCCCCSCRNVQQGVVSDSSFIKEEAYFFFYLIDLPQVTITQLVSQCQDNGRRINVVLRKLGAMGGNLAQKMSLWNHFILKNAFTCRGVFDRLQFWT